MQGSPCAAQPGPCAGPAAWCPAPHLVQQLLERGGALHREQLDVACRGGGAGWRTALAAVQWLRLAGLANFPKLSQTEGRPSQYDMGAEASVIHAEQQRSLHAFSITALPLPPTAPPPTLLRPARAAAAGEEGVARVVRRLHAVPAHNSSISISSLEQALRLSAAAQRTRRTSLGSRPWLCPACGAALIWGPFPQTN